MLFLAGVEAVRDGFRMELKQREDQIARRQRADLFDDECEENREESHAKVGRSAL